MAMAEDLTINFTYYNGTQNGTFEYEEYAMEPFEQFVQYVNTYFIPVLVVIGLIGNIVSVIVFFCTYLKNLSLGIHLAALALSDSGFLMALFITWLESVGFKVFDKPGWCQSVVYATYVCSFLSVWVVASYTVERYIAICHPLKRPDMCTPARAKMVVSGLTLGCLLVYICTFWSTGVVTIGDQHYCVALPDYRKVNTVLTYADTTITLIIPFLLILGLNIKITHKIAYFYAKRSRHPSRSRAAYHRNAQSQSQSQPRASRPGHCTLGYRAQIKITKALLMISSIFLVINLPSYVVRLRIFILSIVNKQYQVTQNEYLIQQLLQVLYYTGFAINFFLYHFCCKKFKNAFRRLCWKWKYRIYNQMRSRYWFYRRDSTSWPPPPSSSLEPNSSSTSSGPEN